MLFDDEGDLFLKERQYFNIGFLRQRQDKRKKDGPILSTLSGFHFNNFSRQIKVDIS